MGVKKKDRVVLPDEPYAVIVRAVDRDDDEVTLVFERSDGSRGEVLLSPAVFDHLTPLRATGAGDPRVALAGLWGHWMARVIAVVRQTTLATTPLRAYAHQDEAVFGAMLPQPTLRFLLADEPGTGKTIMTGMYIAEMCRQGLLQRALIVVPAHLVPKWERDLQRFFGLDTERLTADVGKSSAPLRPDRHFWVVSVDLLARNPQVQRKAIFAAEGAWDLVVFDEAHRLTPTAQTAFPMASELASRCPHLLLLTATPHRGSEYLFRALLHLLDPAVYPWSPDDDGRLGPDTPRLRPARTHFIRRMKESLRDHDNVTPLFPKRRAHNVSVGLSATELQLYEDILDYCDRYFDDASGLVRSVYGKRAASSLYALSETLGRRSDRLRSRGGSASGTVRGLVQPLDTADLADDDDETQNGLEDRVNAVASTDTSAELGVITTLRSRISALLRDPSFIPAKWRQVSQEVLPQHGIAPGRHEQLLIFTEFADTATWLVRVFSGQGFTVRRYAGDVSRDERERIQADFQDKKFDVLISTDAGNEGIDLQSAHVLVNWDIPWSIVRLEQRVGRLHRIGQRSQVDIYNLISTSTREGRVQEVILNNIVAAADALDGQIFDFLGSVVDHLGVDYTGLLVQAGAGGTSTDEAVAAARRVTADQYKRASEEQRRVENRLATLTDGDAFAAHNLQDRLDAVNPAVVAAFVRVLASARGWHISSGLYEDLLWLHVPEDAPKTTTLPIALGGDRRALVAMSADALMQARREGADLAGAIVLGPADMQYRTLVNQIVCDSNDALAAGVVLDDQSALTPYELLVFDAALSRRQGSGVVERPYPLLIRSDGSGVRVVGWQSVAHLTVPLSGQGHADFAPGPALQAEVVASTEMARQAEKITSDLRTWEDGVAAQLDRLQDEVMEPYQNLPQAERKERRAAIGQAVADRKRLLRESTVVEVRPPRLVGRVHVRALGGVGAHRTDSNSEAVSMLLCAQLLEAEGFHVDDVHQDGCGYDLKAHRGYEQRCVEVKGLQGDISPGIMLESSEWLMAQQLRDDFWVYVFEHCASAPRLFGAYRNPVALFSDSKQLVQRFHVSAPALRKVLMS